MPRGGGGGFRSGGGGSWSRSRPAAKVPTAVPTSDNKSRNSPQPVPAGQTPLKNPPQQVAHAPPPPAPMQNGNVSGWGSSFARAFSDGLAWGTSRVAVDRAADAVLGPRVISVHDTATSSAPTVAACAAHDTCGPCGDQCKALQDCLYNNASDISKCQFYMDVLQQCRISPSADFLNA